MRSWQTTIREGVDRPEIARAFFDFCAFFRTAEELRELENIAIQAEWQTVSEAWTIGAGMQHRRGCLEAAKKWTKQGRRQSPTGPPGPGPSFLCASAHVCLICVQGAATSCKTREPAKAR